MARFILKPVEARARLGRGEGGGANVEEGLFLLTDDGRGVASALASALELRRARPVLVRRGGAVSKLSERVYEADLTDLRQTEELLELVRREEGRVSSLVHLLPLSGSPEFEEMTPSEFQERAGLEVKSLFNLARSAARDLKGGEGRAAGLVLAATPLGGESTERASFASAGVAGLVKTLDLEWPGVACRAAHVDAGETAQSLAALLLREIFAGAGEAEVVYRDGARFTPQAEAAPLGGREESAPLIDSRSVVLITGGARGITASVALDLARRYRPTLVLVGRSPLPPSEEPADTAALSSPKEIKAALIKRLRDAGETPTPARVETLCARLLNDRAMRRSLAEITRAGARVEYRQADVKDSESFARIFEDVYRQHGRLDGVIHGAGVIEDKLVEDKSPESFDRVFDTKVNGAFVLARALRPETKFVVFFSSVAGAFGNRGQGDYAAANEVLNKLALRLDARMAGRVVAINWGPWEGVGMVSEEVRDQLARRGVEMIAPEEGSSAVDRELRLGRKGEVEVVLGRGPWETSRAEWAASTNSSANDWTN